MIPLLVHVPPHNFTDYFHYLIVLMGTFMIGINIAFIFYAPALFPKETCYFWRIFFVGKSVLTGLIAAELYERTGPITWRTPWALAGIGVSLYALWVIFKDRPYATIPSAIEEEHERSRSDDT